MHGDGPILRSQCDLLINEIVVKPDCCCVRSRISIIHSRDSGPEYSSQAHGTRFATGEERAILKLVCIQFPARVTDRHDLGVCRGVIGRRDLIIAARHDLASTDDHAAERTSPAAAHSNFGFFDRLSHELLFVHKLDGGKLLIGLWSRLKNEAFEKDGQPL